MNQKAGIMIKKTYVFDACNPFHVDAHVETHFSCLVVEFGTH